MGQDMHALLYENKKNLLLICSMIIKVEMRVAGNDLRFSLEGVLERLERAEFGPVREHAVEVKGKYLPVKEAFALISGLD